MTNLGFVENWYALYACIRAEEELSPDKACKMMNVVSNYAKSKKFEITIEELTKLYNVDLLSDNKIGRLFNVDRKKVMQKRKEYGIKARAWKGCTSGKA